MRGVSWQAKAKATARTSVIDMLARPHKVGTRLLINTASVTL